MKQKIPFKHFLLLSILLAASLPAFSQHFDWVKSYTATEVSGEYTNCIIDSHMDSLGNLYILGEFSPMAELAGVDLLPHEIVTSQHKGIVIAKLSSSGNVVWHKSIYGPQNSYAYAMSQIRDTAFMVMVGFKMSHNFNSNLYYLDTLLSSSDAGYLQYSDSTISNLTTGFITFDLDGNVVEQHFLELGYIDDDGHAITMGMFSPGHPNSNALYSSALSDETFSIDGDGNIYVCRRANDGMAIHYPSGTRSITIENGSIAALKIVVDGSRSLRYPINQYSAKWNQQILKFSPHFESILDGFFLFDSTTVYSNSATYTNAYSLNIDSEKRIYLSLQGYEYPDSLLVTRTSGKKYYSLNRVHFDGCMIMFDSNLVAQHVIQLTSIDPERNFSKNYFFFDTYVDEQNGCVYVLGTMQRDPLHSTTPNCYVFYNTDTVDLRNNLFWFKLRIDDGKLLSYGKAQSSVQTNLGNRRNKNIVVYNNRVFSQVRYSNDISWDGGGINVNEGQGIGLMVWDTAGNVLMYLDYNALHSNNETGQIHILDSTLYLTGSIYSGATFTPYTLNSVGASQAYIAKYVDPAFAEPYVHPSDRQEQTIEWQQDLVFTLADSPVTLTATATSGLPVSYTCSDSTIAYVEGGRLHLVADGYAWLTATQGGDYQYLPAEPVQRLLTVGNVGIATVTADGQAKAYPNPTSGKVTIDLAKIPPAPPLPYQRPRPSDTSDVDMVLYTSPGAPFPQYETCRFPYHQRYNMKVSGSALQSHDGVVTAWLTDMQGRREEVVLTPTGPDQYTLDLTNRPPAAYLLTVTTADGRELTFRLMRQYGRR